jgi:hypothetical protein
VEPYKLDGDVRIITRFLFFPKRIGAEVRWLEKAKIRQQARRGSYGIVRWHDYLWEND